MSSATQRLFALGRAARDAFERGDIEEATLLVEERGRALAGLTALEVGHGAFAQLQSENGELIRAAEAARDAIGAELRRVSRPKSYPVAG